jgi:hypothetical protein
VGFEILHGIRDKLKRSINISASHKIGTTVTSPGKKFNFSFSAERGQ